MPSSLALYFQGSSLSLSFCDTWSCSMCNVLIVYKNYRQLHWCCREWPFISLVKMYIVITEQFKLIYVSKVVQYPSLFKLVCCILKLADKHGITLILAYISPNLNVKADYHLLKRLVLEWHCLPQITWVAFQLWAQPEVDLMASSCVNQYQHYYTFHTPLGCLRVEHFQPCLAVSGKLWFSSCVSSSSSVQVSSGTTCQYR